MTTKLNGGVKFPPVLDACCGGRHFWFDKNDSRAAYVDIRSETILWGGKQRPGRSPTIVDPDYVADFRNLPFPDATFSLVVFDPPHASFGETGIMAKTYGKLFKDWRDMISEGFAECFRVLRQDGTLIFKWNETQIPLPEILSLTPHKPLFGHLCGLRSRTHWVAFIKHNFAGNSAQLNKTKSGNGDMTATREPDLHSAAKPKTQ